MVPIDSNVSDGSQCGQYFVLDAWSMPPMFNACTFDGSRTDKPQMAHEIYKRLLVIASSSSRVPLNSVNVPQHASGAMHKCSVSHLGQQSIAGFNSNNQVFSKQDILTAAYTGCNLMYRQQQRRLEN